MGLNICVYGSGTDEHPDWDWSAYSGDREFAAMISKLPHKRENRLPEPDLELFYRPTDFAIWRKAIAAGNWDNGPDRYLALVDLLENNPECWIYLSY